MGGRFSIRAKPSQASGASLLLKRGPSSSSFSFLAFTYKHSLDDVVINKGTCAVTTTERCFIFLQNVTFTPFLGETKERGVVRCA